MVVEIGNILKSYLEPLVSDGSTSTKFIDKLAGVIKVVTKTEMGDSNNPIRKTFPVSCNINFEDCNNNGAYKDLIPNSLLGCIVYFEDLGIRLVNEERGYRRWRSSYRMIGWINQKKLGTNECNVTGTIINTLINQFPSKAFNSGIYTQCLIEVLGQDPKSLNPFSKFTYDEDRTQYLMNPFDYFSLQIDVTCSVHGSCVVAFEKQTENNCNTNKY